MTINGEDGKPMAEIPRAIFDDKVTRVDTAHFGLTLIRADVFKKLPKPWFYAHPSGSGDWDEGRIDDDIWFWRKLKESGMDVYQANKVVIGHLELMGCWPGKDFRTIYQHPSEFHKTGKPPESWP